jgi:valyl-tRNA synthetase
MEWLISLISGIRSVRTEMNVPAGAKIPLVVVGAGATTGDRIETHLASISRIARLASVDYSSEVPRDSAQIVLNEATFALPLAGVIDIGVERLRLEREIEKIDDEVEKIDRKLGNPQFVAKAPEEVIEEQRSRRDEAMLRREKLVAALKRLN